jgi:GNAT superfamily N-acetyltransferase
MTVEYRVNAPLSVEQFVDVLVRSTLADRRPVSDRSCMAGMLSQATLTVTAWEGDRLIGIARSLTDFTYVCYLADLAVDVAYQRTGIGRALVARTRACLAERAAIVLLAAPAAADYYGKIGFVRHERCWVSGAIGSAGAPDPGPRPEALMDSPSGARSSDTE